MLRIENITDFDNYIIPRYTKKTLLFDGRIVVYTYTTLKSDIFENPYMLECRGITFDTRSGRVLSRPIHKFFNVGENDMSSKKEFEELLTTHEHIIINKLDGSMVSPLLLDGDIVFKMKKSVFDKSHLTDSIKEECKYYLERNICPIFEYIGPTNKIVVDYDDEKLILIAMRNLITGEYLSRNLLEQTNFEVVDCYSDLRVLDRTDIEGVVVWFLDINRFFKLKTKWYITRHKYVFCNGGSLEKTLKTAIMKNKIDDIIPHLIPDELVVLEKVYSDIYRVCDRKLQSLRNMLPTNCEGMGNQDFVKWVKRQQFNAKAMMGFMFMIKKNKPIYQRSLYKLDISRRDM